MSNSSMSIVPCTGDEPHADVRKKIINLANQIDKCRWELAGYLKRVFEENLYIHWGYKNWDEYVETELPISPRTVRAIKYLFNTLESNLLVSDEKKEKIQDLGWTKATQLARLEKAKILKPDNMDEWIEKADKTSAVKLKETVKKEISKSKGEDEPEIFRNKTFRLAVDQLEIVENAIQMASAMLESDKPGHCISMVCQDFVATNMFQKRKDRSLMGQYLNKIGAILGARIIAVDKETGKVIHNSKLFEKMKGQS